MRWDPIAAVPFLLAVAALDATAGQLGPIQSVTFGECREFRVNGKPFFPLMLWLQSDVRIPDGLSVAVNTFCGNGGKRSRKAYLDRLAASGLYGVVHSDEASVGHSHLLGWIHGDEPDLPTKKSHADVVPRVSVDKVAEAYGKLKALDPTRPVFVTFTAHFMKAFTDKYDAATKHALYPGYVKSCDVAGYDVYPIFGWNKPEWLIRVADGVTELRAIAGPRRPVYAWIETNVGSRWISPSAQKPLTPQHTRAEVWMAIIRGATAIGYFTHQWRPSYRQFAPTDDMRRELKRLNEQITRLAPAILASPAPVRVQVKMARGPVTHFKATQLGDSLYVFVQNLETYRNKVWIAIEGLKDDATAEVTEGGQTTSLAGRNGKFVSGIGPLAERIYRIKR